MCSLFFARAERTGRSSSGRRGREVAQTSARRRARVALFVAIVRWCMSSERCVNPVSRIGVLGAGILCVLAIGCGSPGSKSAASPYAAAPDPSAPLPTDVDPPWTSEFSKPAMLIADDISIEGPPGLIAHFAARVDPDVHQQVQKTIAEGFLQQITLKPGNTDAEINAQLDNLALVATRRMSALERPGRVDLVVRARGRVSWHDLATKEVKRAETMTLTGKSAR
jgi:hypothetical protein